MSEELEVIRGTGNVYRDVGFADADVRQLRAILAARIIGVLDDRGYTVREAGEQTGMAPADFSRIRNAKLGRFTIDRLITILNRLDQQVDVSVDVAPRSKVA